MKEALQNKMFIIAKWWKQEEFMELGGYLIEESEFTFSLSNLTKYIYTSVYIYRVGGREYNNDIKLVLTVKS